MSRGTRTRSCAVALLLCTMMVLLAGETSETEANWQTCSLWCSEQQETNEIHCTMEVWNDQLKRNFCHEVYSSILRNASSLDLSDKNLTEVPIWVFPFCKSLTKLFLERNSIKTIEPGTFTDLRNLRYLDLSFNDLREWKFDPSKELQSLNDLYLTGNEHWIPDEQLSELKNITKVIDVTLSVHCKDCWLVKPRPEKDAEFISTYGCKHLYGVSSAWPWNDQVRYGKLLDFIKADLLPTCLCEEACFTEQLGLPFAQATRDVVHKASFSLYATGSVALLVNITVILVIVFHKSLRNDLPVCLTLNIAVCDFVVGLFSVLHANIYPKVLYVDQLRGNLEDYHYFRVIVGPILTCAVMSQVCGSFILTLEKFLKIVYAMRPNIRIGKRCAIIFVFLSWLLSVTLAVLPVFEIGQMTYSYEYRFPAIPLPSGIIADIVQIVLIITQLTSFVLYLPIFIVAKRSGTSLGIKREARLARKIALLVFTNLIFFTVPVVLVLFQVGLHQAVPSDRKLAHMPDYSLTKYQWSSFAVITLPVLCVSINSVLNPFLYALRYHKIKQQLKQVFASCRTVFRGGFVALGQHIQMVPNTNQREPN